MITARTQIKEIIRNEGINNMTSDFMDRLDKAVKDLVIKACDRAKENQRKTVMGRDI